MGAASLIVPSPRTEDERARIQGCEDAATLDRWVENVLGAKNAGDVLR